MERDFRLGNWQVQPLRNQMAGPNGSVKLEPRITRLLVCLAERPGAIVSREELTEKVWEGSFVSDEVLTQSISELRKALGDDPKEPRFVQTVPRQGYRLIVPVEQGSRGRARRAAPAVAVGVVAAAVVAWLFSVMRDTEPAKPVRLAVQLPDGAAHFHPDIVISPDGSSVAFTAATDSGDRLFARSLDRLEATVLADGLDRSTRFYSGNIAFSPDGQWVAFPARGRLWKVSVRGGTPVPICDAIEVQGIDWGEDDQIVYGVAVSPSLLQRVPAGGGTPETLLASESREFYSSPRMLPGRGAVLFAIGQSIVDSSVAVLDLGTRKKKILVDGSVPRYVPTGHLMFAREDSVFAAPFDTRRLELTGPAFPVLDRGQIHFRGPTHEAALSVSAAGTLLYAPPIEAPERRLLVVDLASGAETPLDLRLPTPKSLNPRFPRFSPDGERLLIDDLRDIWIYDLEQGTSSVLPSDDSIDYRPIWTPDGDHVVFVSNRDSGADIFIQVADGTAPAKKMIDEMSTVPSVFSSDGRFFLYMAQGSGLWDIWMLEMNGDSGPQPFLNERHFEVTPYFSPDGRWVAYGSDETGDFEVYVRRFPDGTRKKTISRGGGTHPVWSPDGKRLLYWQHDQLMAATIHSTESEIVVGEPEVLLRGAPGPAGGNRTFDLHPDGETLLMYEEVSEPPPPRTHLVIVQNWLSELESLTESE